MEGLSKWQGPWRAGEGDTTSHGDSSTCLLDTGAVLAGQVRWGHLERLPALRPPCFPRMKVRPGILVLPLSGWLLPSGSGFVPRGSHLCNLLFLK